MVVATVPFIPPFVMGTVFLLGPSFIVALLFGDTVSAIVAGLTAVAAFIWPRDNLYLSAILCALRTVSFLAVIVMLVVLRIGHADASRYLLPLGPLAVGAVAQWRIRSLIRDATLGI